MSKNIESGTRWLRFDIDKNSLLVRHSDVVSTLLLSDVHGTNQNKLGSLSFDYDNEKWQAFNVDERLFPSAKVSNARKYCVILQNGDKLAGILCDQIQILDSAENLKIFSMPVSLKQKFSPFTQIAVLNGEVLSIGTGEKIILYVKKLSQILTKKGANHGRS